MKYANANKDEIKRLVFDTIAEYELRHSRPMSRNNAQKKGTFFLR